MHVDPPVPPLQADPFLLAPIGVYTATREGRVVYANLACARLLGYDAAADLCGLATSQFYQDPGEQETWLCEDPHAADTITRERAWLTRDGRPLTVRLTGRRLDPASTGWEGCQVFVEDLTEARRMETEMRQAQKMEGIGRLAAEIAHDFNNLLTAILGYTDLVLEQIDAAKPIHADLCEIQSASRRAAALTHQLLNYSRQQTRVATVLDLNDVVRTVEVLLRRILGERVRLVVECAPDTLRLSGDRGQLEQVMVNLAINARDAMPNGGTVTLRTERIDAPPQPVKDGRLASGCYVQLSVTDTGIGMDAATQARIFEPFFSTKAAGRGTGLGLTILDGIVRQMGGWLSVTSAPHCGSTFYVTVPASPDAVTPDSVDPRTAVDMGRETLLVVDDDPGVLSLVCTTLTRHGYRVMAAGSAEEALALVSKAVVPITLVVTDVALPGMTGRELMARLRTHGCHRVVYMSGYPARDARGSTPADATTRCLAKPFTPRELLTEVRRMMDGHRQAGVPQPGGGPGPGTEEAPWPI